MVLVRRKDNRKGNETDNLDVISSNKGVRSMNNNMTGRFAADMRVRVGGYGRPDQTWGVDHPWHKTGEADLFQMISAKDKMEDGVLLKEQPKPEAKGLSRAPPPPPPTTTHIEVDDQEEKAAPTKKKSLFDDSDDEDEAPKPVAKKTKIEPKKPELKKKAVKKDDNLNKREKKKAELEKQAAREDLKMLVTEAPKSFVEPLDVREALAAEYEAKIGAEIATPSGITLRDLSIGRGKLPMPGQMLTVRYRGCIGSKGGAIFGKGMLTMKFGEGAVIAGWEEGMATMRASGKRLLTIPPELAYGAAGKGDKIPPNSTLFFDVELVRIGLRQRDAITETDVPLPKSFVRKRVEKKAKDEAEKTPAPTDANKKKKPKRIKY
ncbi:hypothetical protein SPRG_12736 [Saprolegnia parasitica CBS 223.65]|uniref:peptidylprolyl isomerase n=1 Tax=Saprolegnia parasitica (strain CBS 223.65) TaxID=695850 RepID=A0A067C018_SAPPC|nr:hypothetical protein SPRG_12736 [Saprolegnia parasitica CBS 223.65]KDO22455.1 hypothetical protein SPRG_12736 [Saprolegnia parasitica CBS 223.65]|eukprot:XP_012206843.1 hypothetical protein SPRG_12736 [Saprolegnia parasitica CBS 223.65]